MDTETGGPSPEEMGLTKEDMKPIAEKQPTDTSKEIKDRPENIKKTERFAKLAKLELENPEERVDTLKNMDADRFLDRLAVANGLLRDQEKFQRWSGKSANVQVSAMTLGVELQPPENSHEIFRQFYERFQSELDTSEIQLEKSAVEMYFAIIGAHMFEDGNGRLARAAYHLIKYGDFPQDKSAILQRPPNAEKAADRVNVETIDELLQKEGVKYEEIDEVAADENKSENSDHNFIDQGLTSQLKYIAARRIMLRNGTWSEDQPRSLGLKGWPQEDLQAFHEEYGQVREEWLRAYISVAGKYAPGLAKLIENKNIGGENE